jgi:TolA-binding protein
MKSSSPESKEQRALFALAEIARDSVRPPTPARLDQGFRTLSARVTARRAGWKALWRWSFVGVSAAATIAIVLVAGRTHPPAPPPPTLAYRIEGGSVTDGGYLRESGRAGVKLSFTGGTEMTLAPGTRGRLRDVGSSGARIAIEHGTASFEVAPSADRRWLVDVGPFLVTVKGTVFTVSWDVSTERFELVLRRGRVTVSGPIAGGDIALQAGRRMVVDVPRAQTLITDLGPGEATGDLAARPAPPAAKASSERAPPGERPRASVGAPATPAPGKKATDGGHRWTEALAAGRLDQILAEVERTGQGATLETASGEDLLALADAARYRRRPALAREALLAARRRFPGSSRAQDTTFLLGRVEESDERGTTRALRWYDEYLASAPNGTYAAEALGRKMILTAKRQGAAQAKPVAQEYLRRFPGGAYAETARALQDTP